MAARSSKVIGARDCAAAPRPPAAARTRFRRRPCVASRVASTAFAVYSWRVHSPVGKGMKLQPGTAPRAAISVSHLSKRFGGQEILKGVSLEIASGETLVVLGPSGSGK